MKKSKATDGKATATRRPATKTIKRVIDWLEQDLGLSIYGGNVDLEAEISYPSCRDYRFEDVMKFHKLLKKYPDGIPEGDEV